MPVRILIYEDNSSLREGLQQLLAADAEVIVAGAFANAENAVEQVKEHKPEVILMDEPCSSLDPVATLKIEDLMRQLSKHYTIVIVTHNMQQAARVSDWTAVMMMADDRAGEVVEFGPTREVFTNPRDRRTEDYITGRFG